MQRKGVGEAITKLMLTLHDWTKNHGHLSVLIIRVEIFHNGILLCHLFKKWGHHNLLTFLYSICPFNLTLCPPHFLCCRYMVCQVGQQLTAQNYTDWSANEISWCISAVFLSPNIYVFAICFSLSGCTKKRSCLAQDSPHYSPAFVCTQDNQLVQHQSWN